MPAGRPTKYNEEILEQARKLALLGLTDQQMADVLGVSRSCLDKWKVAHPEFLRIVKEAKEMADAKMAEALYHRGLGYSHPEEKILVVDGQIERVATVKHYPPDTQAAKFWMMNRQPHLFRDKREVEHSGTVTLEEMLTDSNEDDN